MTNMRLRSPISLIVFGFASMTTGVLLGAKLASGEFNQRAIHVDVTSELAIDPYIQYMSEIVPDPNTGYVDYILSDLIKGKTTADLEKELRQFGYVERPFESFAGIPQTFYTFEKTLRFDVLCQTYSLNATPTEAADAWRKGDRNFVISKNQKIASLTGFIHQSGCFS